MERGPEIRKAIERAVGTADPNALVQRERVVHAAATVEAFLQGHISSSQS